MRIVGWGIHPVAPAKKHLKCFSFVFKVTLLQNFNFDYDPFA